MQSDMPIEDHGRSLEDAFFRATDQRIIEQMKQAAERHDAKAGLKAASGIEDEAILEQLVDLKIAAPTLAALAVAPLVLVAWADGKLDASERKAILKAAEDTGMKSGTAGHDLLESWLASPPPAKALGTWETYTKSLCLKLDPASRKQLREGLIERAKRIAKASGGFLGVVSSISAAEQKMLDRLAAAF